MHDARDTWRTRADIRTNPPSNVIALRPRKAATIIPAIPDPLADDAPKGRFVDQINAVAAQWAAGHRQRPASPEGTPDLRTLERARLLNELAASWGVDLRLALSIGNGTAADQPKPHHSARVLPFHGEARP